MLVNFGEMALKVTVVGVSQNASMDVHLMLEKCLT